MFCSLISLLNANLVSEVQIKLYAICMSDSALADHCARLQIIFTYLLTLSSYWETVLVKIKLCS